MKDLISSGMNGFQDLVTQILYSDVLLELRNARNDGHLKALLRKSVEQLKNDLSWLRNFSAKHSFCWKILSTCCSNITVSKDSFDWVHHYFISKDLNLGLVFNNYCTCKLIPSDLRLIIALPTEIQAHPSSDLHRYVTGNYLILSMSSHIFIARRAHSTQGTGKPRIISRWTIGAIQWMCIRSGQLAASL